jgi:hypothetical protein
MRIPCTTGQRFEFSYLCFEFISCFVLRISSFPRSSRLIHLELGAAPDDLDALDFVDGFADTFPHDLLTEPAALFDQLELQLAPIVHGQINPRRMMPMEVRFIDDRLDALRDFHARHHTANWSGAN